MNFVQEASKTSKGSERDKLNEEGRMRPQKECCWEGDALARTKGSLTVDDETSASSLPFAQLAP